MSSSSSSLFFSLSFCFFFLLTLFLPLLQVVVRAHKRHEDPKNIFVANNNKKIQSEDKNKDLNSSSSKATRNFYSFSAVDIDGNVIELSQYAGMVSLVVNVASECGYTDINYRALVQLQQTLRKSKFTVLAFPCNQFGDQEPGENWQIQNFAQRIFRVNFPMFAKIDVLGQRVPESWKFLIETSGKKPSWNFWKYLVNENGVVLNVWDPEVSFSEIYKEIREAIDKPRLNRHVHWDL